MFRILLVDDDTQLRGTLATYLQRCGFDAPDQAGDGLEALSAVSTHSTDIVITDCQMPTMDGISFVRSLRSRGHRMPVIMLSGQGDPRVVQAALSAGVSHYVQKPLNPPQLLDLIRRLSLQAQAA